MEDRRNKITSGQFMIMTISSQVGIGIFCQSYKLAVEVGHDGWIPLALSGIFSIILFVLFIKLMERYGNKSLFEINKNNIKVVCLDGFRLAIREETIDSDNFESFNFIVPAKTLNEVLKLLTDNEEDIVEISLSKKLIMFNFNGIILISRLLEGEFLNYNSVLLKEVKLTAKVNVKDFADSIDRASLVINEKLSLNLRLTHTGDFE
jgi:DNA polymerase III sliding clamp (beta) subunit (PCNA family)